MKLSYLLATAMYASIGCWTRGQDRTCRQAVRSPQVGIRGETGTKIMSGL